MVQPSKKRNLGRSSGKGPETKTAYPSPSISMTPDVQVVPGTYAMNRRRNSVDRQKMCACWAPRERFSFGASRARCADSWLRRIGFVFSSHSPAGFGFVLSNHLITTTNANGQTKLGSFGIADDPAGSKPGFTSMASKNDRTNGRKVALFSPVYPIFANSKFRPGLPGFKRAGGWTFGFRMSTIELPVEEPLSGGLESGLAWMASRPVPVAPADSRLLRSPHDDHPAADRDRRARPL